MSADRAGDGAPAARAEPGHRSAATLLTDLVDQITGLFRKEIQLLRAELGEKAVQAGTAIGMIGAGTLLAFVALNALVAALIVALAELGLGEGWAALLAGVVVAAVGMALLGAGIRSLRASKLKPERTARSLRQDATVARDSVR